MPPFHKLDCETKFNLVNSPLVCNRRLLTDEALQLNNEHLIESMNRINYVIQSKIDEFQIADSLHFGNCTLFTVKLVQLFPHIHLDFGKELLMSMLHQQSKSLNEDFITLRHGIKIDGRLRGKETKLVIDASQWYSFDIEEIVAEAGDVVQLFESTPSKRQHSTKKQSSLGLNLDLDDFKQNIEDVSVDKWNSVSASKMKQHVKLLIERINNLKREKSENEEIIEELTNEIYEYVDDIISLKVSCMLNSSSRIFTTSLVTISSK